MIDAFIGGFTFTLIAIVIGIGALIMWDELRMWLWRARSG